MARGGPRPGSGRPRGSRNRRTVEMTERLDRLRLDPIAALARLAQHAEAEGDLTLAERCWRGLLALCRAEADAAAAGSSRS